QIGDSHTAGDMVTNGWRTRLQARYGNGGRGVLAAGRPYAGYLTWSVTAQQSPGWLANASFGPAYRADGPAIGLSGFTQSTAAAGQTLSVSADSPDEDFDRIVVCALTGPGAGTLMLGMDEAQEVWPLDAPAPAASCRTMDHDVPVGSATINTVDARPVSITSFATFRRGGGVTLSNLGVVGAQLVHFARTSDAVVQAELAAYRPDLIVLAFGTNEGFDTDLPPAEYEAALRGQIARLRRLAGHDVPILLLGPPDAAARQPAGLAGACGDGWSVPAGLGAVRARQLRVARELRLAFWDWAAAMGGRCASSAWRASDEMRGDHVHFTRSGGDRIGAMLDADIARALELEPAGDAEGRGR
ncbi:MAG: SGNH/GDSL hydrolase family protein, partial [Sphingomonadaceae bacterium]|nr:SGNH/GDSL hydrolase family protein [Sphingomonadaceae bacterium]